MIVDHFETEPEQAPPRITIKTGGRQVTSQKRGRLFFMKNSDQNFRGDHPQLTVTKLDKKTFQHKYGDRSGIQMWGFHERLNCWMVKIKSKNVEY